MGEGPLIVRSSCLTEDSSTASYAGMFSSIVCGNRKDIFETIRKVWLSSYLPRAQKYRSAHADTGLDMGPQEIQVGILKRLRGAPICRHTEKFEMVYSPFPPYEIRRNRDISFEEMRALKRFSRYWDLVSNSGVFPEASVLLCRGDSPFRSFMDFSEYIYSETRRTYAISRGCLQELIRIYLIQNSGLPSAEVNAALERDAFNAVRAKKKKSPKRQALRG